MSALVRESKAEAETDEVDDNGSDSSDEDTESRRGPAVSPEVGRLQVELRQGILDLLRCAGV